MYIAPQSVFKLISGVPFNDDYQHTIWFANQSQQLTYFESKVVSTFTNVTYIKKDKVVRLEVCADNIYQCNYCMFKNTGFGDKWFFGFVTHTEYANNDVTFLTVEIDYVQTWMFDFTFNTSLVEREHVVNDTIGLHTVDEQLPVGDYIVHNTVCTTDSTHTNREWYEPAIGIYASARMNGDEYRMINGVFTSMATLGFNPDTNMHDLKDFMDLVSAAPELIAMICMVNKGMISSSSATTDTGITVHFLKMFLDDLTITRSTTNPFTFRGDSYTPRNNKLYCYPYMYIVGSNLNGASQVYKWEDFDTADSNPQPTMSATFGIKAIPQPKPCMEMYPSWYKEQGVVERINTWGIQFDNFPMCPFNIDSFYAWCSQALPQGMGNIGATLGVASGNMYQGSGNTVVDQQVYGNADPLKASTKSTLGALGVGISTAALGVQMWQHAIHSTALGGTVGSSGMTYGTDRLGFKLSNYTIKPEYARIIDDYFTRFGYKVDRYKVPELTSRQSFNYVKTVECNLGGNIPNEANAMLCSIFNRGITLWHTTQVGNYSLPNEIVGE